MNSVVNHQSLLHSKPVKEEDLGRAAIAIEYVEQYLLKACSKRHKVTYDIAKSDYYIRKAQMNGVTSSYSPELKQQYAREGEFALCFLLRQHYSTKVRFQALYCKIDVWQGEGEWGCEPKPFSD
jgi:hypothetical protein